MPNYTDEQKRQGLVNLGYDPDKFDVQVDDNDNATITPRAATQPALGVVSPQANNSYTTTATPMQSALHSFAHNALPASVGGATGLGVGALLSAALAPETFGASLIPLAGGLISGLGAGALTSKVQPNIVQSLPSVVGGGDEGLAQWQQQQQMMEQHPYASALGAGAANILGGMLPSPTGLIRAGQTLMRPSRLLTGSVPTSEISNLANVALGAGLPVASSLASGQPIDPKQLGLETLVGALFNRGIGHSLPEAPQSNGNVGGRMLEANRPTYSTTATEAPELGAFANSIQQRIEMQPNRANLASESSLRKLIGPTYDWRQSVVPDENDLARMEGEGGNISGQLQHERGIQYLDDIRAKQEADDLHNQFLSQRSADFQKAQRELADEQVRNVQLEAQRQKEANDNKESYFTSLSPNQNKYLVNNLNQVGSKSLSTEPVIDPALESRDNTANIETVANKNATAPMTEAERIQDEYDRGIRNQPAEDKNTNGSLVDWLNNHFASLGERRNITLSNVGDLVDANGNKLNGQALLKERIVKIAKSANTDTWPHEFTHIAINDMLTSPNVTQRKLAQRMLNETVPNMPEFKAVNDKLVAEGQAPYDPEEFITQLSGEQLSNVFHKIASGEGSTKYSEFQKVKDAIANRWGNPSAEQTARMLNEIVTTSPTYDASHGIITSDVAASGAKNQPQDNNELKRIAFHDQLQGDVEERARKGIELWKQSGLKVGDVLFTPKGTRIELSSEGISVNKKGEPTVIGKYVDPITGEESTSSYYLNKLLYDDPTIKSQPANRTPIKEATHIGTQEGFEDIPAKEMYNLHKDIVDKDGNVLHPANSTVSQDTLDQHNVKYQPSNRDKLLTIKGVQSGIDAVRSGGTEQHDKVADALDATLKQRQELLGATNNKVMASLDGLNKEAQDRVEKALNLSRQTKSSTIGMLSSYKEKQAYKAAQDALSLVGQFRKDNNLPITSPSGAKKAGGQDPYYYPHTMDSKVAQNIANGVNVDAYKKDFVTHATEQGVSDKEANNRFDELAAVLRGDKSNASTGNRNAAFFNAIRKSEGIGLPNSMRNKNLRENMANYFNRAATDLSYAKHVESNPYVAKSLGYDKDLWDKPLPTSVDKVTSLMGNQAIKSAVDSIIKPNAVGEYGEQLPHKIESAATATMLGPLTEIHKMATNFFNGLTYAGSPKEVVGVVTHAITNLSDNYAKALDTGNIQLPKARAEDNIRILMDGTEQGYKRIGAATNLLRGAYTLGHTTDNLTKAYLQGVGEYLIPHKIVAARNGDANATNFIRNLDPSFDPAKPYTNDDVSKLSSRFSGEIHGTHDIRTMPAWMLKDGELQAFAKLASWSILQTNNLTKHVITPATKGNFTPLLLAALGGTLGGAVVKELREKTNDRIGNIPTLNELLAADNLKAQGMGGRSLSDNQPLLAYKLADLMSIGGFGGLVSNAIKIGFDEVYKNNPTSGAVFPLDQVASSTATIAGNYVGALLNPKEGDSDFMTITASALEDWINSNSQLGRIAMQKVNSVLNTEEAQRHELSEKTSTLRRYKMVEGLPYEAQNGEAGSNPYMTLSAYQYKHEQDMNKIPDEGVNLVTSTIDKWKDNPAVLKDKLDALRNMSNNTMPSDVETPFEFARYLSYLAAKDGSEKATEAYVNYIKSQSLNDVKKSIVPVL